MSLKTENRHVIKQHNFEALIKKRKTSENTLSYLVLVCIICSSCFTLHADGALNIK